MDPPRQVSRRGPGSGPVFRTVKKQPNSAFSPQHYSSTARSLHTQPIPSFPITIPDRNVPKAETADNLRARPIALKDIASTTLPIEVKLHKLTSDIEDDKNEADTTRIHTRSKPVKKPSHPEIISGPRTRCRSHKLDEAAPWASVSVSVAIAASATLQRNISPETMKKSRDRSRKNKLSHARKLNENNRRQCVAPDKISVNAASENPTLDTLWASAAEQWKEPTEEDALLLKSLMAENLAGCVKFIEHDYKAESIATGNFEEINENPSRNFVCREIVRSGRCLPPVGILNCGKESSSFKMESNELLEILAQAGGVDEGVWQQLHRLYDLQAECSPPSQAAVVPSSSSGHRIGSSSGSRLSRSTELDYSTASNTPGPDSLHQNDLTANDREGRLCADRVTSSFIDADSDADVDTLEAYRQKRRFSDPITSALMAVADANASAARHLNCGIRGAFGGMERALRDGSAQHRASNTSNSAEATTADGYNSFPLGRRGVRYTDVWEEEDFLQKVNKAHALTAVDDRSSLLHSYSDTHDGPYRDWNMRHTAAIAAASKKEAALSSSRWSRISLPPNGVGNDCGNKGFCVLAPPVPVSIFHPSCWSMTARKVAQNTFVNVQERITQPGVAATGDLNPGVFELVHPAALSSSIVELPGAAALRERLTDIDDLTILGDALSREVCAVEASNYLRLQSLSRAVDISCQLSGVRLRKAQLIEALVLMYQRNEYEYEADRRLAYANMPSPPTPVIPPFSSCPGPWTLRATKDKGCSLPSLDADARKVCAPEEPLATLISARQPRYSTRFASSSALSALPTALEQKKDRRIQLGACLVEHVPHGHFVAALKKGDPVEVFREDAWRAGRVLSIRSDDHLMRLVKVGALGGAAGDHVWAAVEDGRIAPPGTHLIGAMFRWMFPSLHINRVPSAKSASATSNLSAGALSSMSGCTSVAGADGGSDYAVSKKRKTAYDDTHPKSKKSKEPTALSVIKKMDKKGKSKTNRKEEEKEEKGIENRSAAPVEEIARLPPLTQCAFLVEKVSPVEKSPGGCRPTGAPAPTPLDLDILSFGQPEYCISDEEAQSLLTEDSSQPHRDISSSHSALTDSATFALSSSEPLFSVKSIGLPTVAVVAATLTMVVSAVDLDLIPSLPVTSMQPVEATHTADRIAEHPNATITPSLSKSPLDDAGEVTEYPLALADAISTCLNVSATVHLASTITSVLDEVPLSLPPSVSASSGLLCTILPSLPLPPPLFLPVPSPLADLQRTAQHTLQTADLDSTEGRDADCTEGRHRHLPPSLDCSLADLDDLNSKTTNGAVPVPHADHIHAICGPRQAELSDRSSRYGSSEGSKGATSALFTEGADADDDSNPPPASTLHVLLSTTQRFHTCAPAHDIVSLSLCISPSHEDVTEDAVSDAATSADCSSQCHWLLDEEPIGANLDCDTKSVKMQTLEDSRRDYWLDNDIVDKCPNVLSWLARDSSADRGLREESGRRSRERKRSPRSRDSHPEDTTAKSRYRGRNRNKSQQPDDTCTDHSRSRSRSEDAKSDGSRRDGSRRGISDEEGAHGCHADHLDERAREGPRKRGRGRHIARGCSTDESSSRDELTSSERGRSVDRHLESARWRSVEEVLGRERKRWRNKEEMVYRQLAGKEEEVREGPVRTLSLPDEGDSSTHRGCCVEIKSQHEFSSRATGETCRVGGTRHSLPRI